MSGMRRFIGVFVGVILCWQPARSQVQYGVRTGLNMSTVTNTSVEIGAKRLAVGPGGGMTLHIPLTEIFAVQPEVQINARGVAVSGTIDNVTTRTTKRLYYLDIPMMIRAYYGFKKMRLYGGMGPQISAGLFVQDVTRISGKHYTNKLKNTERFSSQTRRYEMAWDFDVGMDLQVGRKSRLEFNVRPMIALINIAKEDFNVDNNRNFMVAFSTAWIFEGRD